MFRVIPVRSIQSGSTGAGRVPWMALTRYGQMQRAIYYLGLVQTTHYKGHCTYTVTFGEVVGN